MLWDVLLYVYDWPPHKSRNEYIQIRMIASILVEISDAEYDSYDDKTSTKIVMIPNMISTPMRTMTMVSKRSP